MLAVISTLGRGYLINIMTKKTLKGAGYQIEK